MRTPRLSVVELYDDVSLLRDEFDAQTRWPLRDAEGTPASCSAAFLSATRNTR